MTGKDEKAERLAAALRANLRRRKAQARGDAHGAVHQPAEPDSDSQGGGDEREAGGGN